MNTGKHIIPLSVTVLTSFILLTAPVAQADENVTTEVATSLVETSSAMDTTAATNADAATTTTSTESATTEVTSITQTTATTTQTEAKSDKATIVTPIPKGLIGTWTTQDADGNAMYTFTFNADGSGTAVWTTASGSETQTFKIDGVELVGEDTYRFVAGDKTYEIAEKGFGGHGVKYQNGFSLSGGIFSPIMWQALIDGDFDYSDLSFKSNRVYIREVEENGTPTEEVLIATPTKTTKTTSSKTSSALPQTGESRKHLLPLAGFVLIGLAIVGKFFKKSVK